MIKNAHLTFIQFYKYGSATAFKMSLTYSKIIYESLTDTDTDIDRY